MAIEAVREERLRSPRRRASASEIVGRALPSALAGLTAAGLVLWMAWRAGGYFPSSHLAAGAVAFLACAVLLVVVRPRYSVSTNALVALGALAGLAAWTGLSAVWSEAPERAIEAMQLDLVYIGLIGLGMLAVGSGRYARYVVWGALAVTCIVCGAALISRLYPDVLSSPKLLADVNYRLAYPLTYSNSLGAMAAFGAVLAFGLAADPRTWWPLRGVGAGLSVALLATMYLSLSRGAWMSLFAGLVILLVFSAHRGSLLLTGAIVVPIAIAAIARVASYPALVDDPLAGSGQEAAGHAYAAQLIVLAGLAVGGQAIVGAARASPVLMRSLDRLFRPLLIGAGVLIAVVVVVGYAWRAADAEGVAAKHLKSAQGWVDRQWDDFMRPAEVVDPTGTSRLTSARGSRSDLYRVAIDGFEGHPLLGDGGGSFHQRWIRDREARESVLNAHSLELETLGETGAVGALLLLAFLSALITAAIRARVRPGGLPRAQVAAVSGACAVWLVHSFVDWDWQQPAFTGTVLVLAATLLPYGRTRVRRRRRSAGREDPLAQAAAAPGARRAR